MAGCWWLLFVVDRDLHSCALILTFFIEAIVLTNALRKSNYNAQNHYSASPFFVKMCMYLLLSVIV